MKYFFQKYKYFFLSFNLILLSACSSIPSNTADGCGSTGAAAVRAAPFAAAAVLRAPSAPAAFAAASPAAFASQ